MSRDYQIRKKGRELLSYQDGLVQCELDCFFDPKQKEYVVILDDQCQSINGEAVHLSTAQLELIENRVRVYLGTERLFGIPIRQCVVSITRKQSAI